MKQTDCDITFSHHNRNSFTSLFPAEINHSLTPKLNRVSSPDGVAGPLHAMQKCKQAIHTFPTHNMTAQERACSHSPSRLRCGWVGGDREIREILDLLDVSAPSSVEWLFFSYLPWFLLQPFCWHACRNVASVQVTVLTGGLVWCSVLHWSNFRTHHATLSPLWLQTHVYFVQDSCQIVRWGWETMEIRLSPFWVCRCAHISIRRYAELQGASSLL